MKAILLFFSLSLGLPALAGPVWKDYVCLAEQLRQNGTLYPVSSSLEFTVVESDGTYTIESLVGNVIAKNYRDASATLDFSSYHGIFHFSQLVNNPAYAGRTYQNHIQFKKFDALHTNTHDGGGMWGYFVLGKTEAGQATTDGHYVFKAGDHMGGTIDYQCYWN